MTNDPVPLSAQESEPTDRNSSERQACSVRITGRVQGVGFRPFVYGLAIRFGLGGKAWNEAGTLAITVEGPPLSLERFLEALQAEAPPLARVDRMAFRSETVQGFERFTIEPSQSSGVPAVSIPPDVATCDACLGEMRSPDDRRYRHPFLNCTQCGPRLTIVAAVPYDRARTTMACFPMCPPCAREYSDPTDRRFHAQPIACPTCGPRLSFIDPQGRSLSLLDPLDFAAQALKQGRIIAIKGLGGYHLAVDASDERAVSELRRRKGREEKPFAVMVADLAAAARYVEVPPPAREALLLPARPVVLLRKKPGAAIAEGVAPGNPHLGIMLPYTPLHYLLLEAVSGLPLVMTSGNATDEPIAYREEEAIDRLSGIADGFLSHDRSIQLRVDDSVLRFAAERPILVRRSRGFAPEPVTLPHAMAQPTLALGGQAKVVFALGAAEHAVMSHHIGDLDDYATYRDYQAAIAHYGDLFRIDPKRLVHDLHPAYVSTSLALQWERDRGMARIAVQHHHAHFAGCLAENGLDEPTIGVIFDGTGYGTDGAIWGGEFLVGDAAGFRRAAHLRYVPMPGGEAAIREPWRMAAAYGWAAGLELSDLATRMGLPALEAVLGIVERGLNSPLTSSMGRLFDAVAGLIGLCDRASFDGQAAMALEALATTEAPDGGYSFHLHQVAETLEIDARPLIREVASQVRSGESLPLIARRFHTSVVGMIAHVCTRLRETTGLETVALSGGVFMNALVLHEAAEQLAAMGFRVLAHRLVPPNDGGLALGQLAVVAARDARKEA